MNYFKYFVKKLDEVIKENDCGFILYPFGERGGLVKGILNAIYGIKEKAIIDNVLCNTYDCIQSLDYLKQIDMSKCKVLITSDNANVYDEIREQLYAVVDKDRCIELLDMPYGVMAVRERPRIIEKMKKEGVDLDKPYYHPKKTKSDFYLPFLPMDSIQCRILLSDDYFERDNLDKVFRDFQNGIIGEVVSSGKGILLDIGANIGNHTLYFCNEYNARKVYCFEPIDRTFSILERNIELNHLTERVVLNKYGLGESNGRGSANSYNLLNTGGTGLILDAEGEIEIKSLDSLYIDERVVFIKIDVEGMERKVLRGGLELIKKYMPYIMVESFEEVFPETRDILGTVGYTYERLGMADWLFYPMTSNYS
mgnify:CR=1 FL=1